MNQLLRYLRAASPAPASAEVPDCELLARFACRQEDSAFATLVSRHGNAVWATCRRLLDRDEDAEDAFQAVFLTLARKAASVSGDCLAAWLHSVARRVAANVRREHRRRTTTEDAARVPEGRSADLSWREGLVILDEEFSRLPERYRAVLIACCLEGRTRDEAARQLSYSEGQVKGLLERGRELLRQRLARRGFDLGALVLAATLANSAAAVPVVPIEAAVRAAKGQSVAGMISSAAVAHSERVVGAMCIHKVKTFVAVLLGAAVAVGGAYTQGAAGGPEPGHAFAPRGGIAVADDPFKGPSKPLPPQKPGRNPFGPAAPPDRKAEGTEKPLQKVPMPEKRPDALTIDQAIQAKRGEKVTVKFEVGTSRWAWVTAFGAKETRVITFFPKTQLKDGGKFQVMVSDKAATHLFNLGLIIEHPVTQTYEQGVSPYFQGKMLRVTGKVEPLEEPVKKGTDYRIVIFDLENLEVVK